VLTRTNRIRFISVTGTMINLCETVTPQRRRLLHGLNRIFCETHVKNAVAVKPFVELLAIIKCFWFYRLVPFYLTLIRAWPKLLDREFTKYIAKFQKIKLQELQYSIFTQHCEKTQSIIRYQPTMSPFMHFVKQNHLCLCFHMNLHVAIL